MGVLDELVGVAVAGDDDDVVAPVAALGGEGGDDVVGLVPGRLEHGDAEGVEHLAHEPELLAEDVGRLLPLGLVGGTASWRKVGSGRSHATAMASGRWSRRRLISIDVNPKTALVTWPEAVAMSVGRAKKAR